MQPFTERVISIIQSIPVGRVMTYGQIAMLAGSHRAARQVVRILHSSSDKYNLPWHRVVNAKGQVGLSDEESRFTQTTMLEQEGVEFGAQHTIDLAIYGYDPE